MTDGLTLANAHTGGTVQRANGYQADSGHQVRARAAVTNRNQTEEERHGLRRLNQVLDADRPLRDDVPRGFYLNLRV